MKGNQEPHKTMRDRALRGWRRAAQRRGSQVSQREGDLRQPVARQKGFLNKRRQAEVTLTHVQLMAVKCSFPRELQVTGISNWMRYKKSPPLKTMFVT